MDYMTLVRAVEDLRNIAELPKEKIRAALDRHIQGLEVELAYVERDIVRNLPILQ